MLVYRRSKMEAGARVVLRMVPACGKSEQLLEAAFHSEVLKCFTVTQKKGTTVAQTVVAQGQRFPRPL
jgi:hypothetical protein